MHLCLFVNWLTCLLQTAPQSGYVRSLLPGDRQVRLLPEEVPGAPPARPGSHRSHGRCRWGAPTRRPDGSRVDL